MNAHASTPSYIRARVLILLLGALWPLQSWSRTCSHDWVVDLVAWSDGAEVPLDTAADSGNGPEASGLWEGSSPGGFVVEPGGDRYSISLFTGEHAQVTIYLTPPEEAR